MQAVLTVIALAASSPLDEYLAKVESVYKWENTGATIDILGGATGHVLNVTSQTWLDPTKAHGPYGGAVWSHQVVVIVPKVVKQTDVALSYLTGGCNHAPGVPSATDEDILVAATVSEMTGAVAIVVFQLPNCPIVYPSDPSKRGRTEDAMIAWAWHEFLVDPAANPEWLPRLPMVKGAMQSMRAAAEFALTLPTPLKLGGWLAAGASKRGWTTWMVGAATCPTCVEIVAIAPLVPIVPALVREMHRQWQAYGGWTFAFQDYMEVNLTAHIDDPKMVQLTDAVDPMNFYDRLARIPKVVVLSSDDEFMMMDWSNVWWDELKGEKYLLIAQNAEHSLATGIPEVLETLANVVATVAAKKALPTFTQTYDPTTGKLSVTIPEGVPHGKVVLRHATTLQNKRRDFRWVRLANNDTGACTFPDIPLSPPLFGGNCLQPVIWLGKTLAADSDDKNTYSATVPTPANGAWTVSLCYVQYPVTFLSCESFSQQFDSLPLTYYLTG